MEDEILLSRINDTVRVAERDGKPSFLGFLSETQAAAADSYLKGRVKYCFFGGYTEAQRRFLCVLPDWAQAEKISFPICEITFRFRKEDRLSHRDFLGALMALGIKRETVGDILSEPGRAVVFFKNDIIKFVKEQITKIGRVGVSLYDGYDLPLPGLSEKKSSVSFIASARLDNVVAALTCNSRNAVTQLLDEKRVSVNGIICEKSTRKIVSSDKITVRGYGKFTVVSVDETSKKGRIILKSEKYI